MIQKVVLAVIGILGTSFLLSPKAYADEAVLNTSRHGAFGRLHFIWPEETGYQAKITGSTLEIIFAKPLDSDVSFLASNLPDYISSATLSKDKKKLSANLTKPFSLRAFSTGNTVFADLIGTGIPLPQKTEAPKAPAVPATPKLDIRTGNHSDYTRLVFAWDKKVPYRMEKSSKEIAIIFPFSADFNRSKLSASLPAELRPFTVRKLKDGMKIAFPLPTGTTVKDSILDNRIILDFVRTPPKVSEPKKPIELAPVPVPPEPKKPLTPPEPAEAKDTKPANEEKVTQASTPAAEQPSAQPEATVKSAEPVAVPENEPPAPLAAPIAQTTQEEIATPAEEIFSLEEDDSELPSEDSVPAPIAAASLSFQQGPESAVAVFKNNGYLWVVFDQAYPVDLNLLRRLGGDIVKEIIQFPSNTATIIRIIVDPRYNPSVRREGTLFILDLMMQPLQPNFALEVTPQADFGMGSRLFIPVTGSSKALTVYDPVIGRNMQVVPVLPLGRGINRLHSYPEADILPSVQGLAIIPKAEDVEARNSNTGVSLLRRNRDFVMSRNASVAPTLRSGTLSEVLNVKEWGYVTPENFKEKREKMQTLPMEVAPAKKDLGRLEYARFLFANNYIPETLGILKVIAKDSPELEATPAFKALRGAANFLMYRYKDAIADFNDPFFANDDDIALWSAAAKVYTQNPADSLPVLKANMSTLRDYPDWLKIKLAFAGLEAAAAAEDELAIQNFLEFTTGNSATSYQKAGNDYYKGKLNQITSAFGTAISNFEKAEAANSRYYRALSARERIKIMQLTEALTPAQAAQELEKLRFAWRAEDYELGILNNLVDLYIEAKDYPQALRTMKDISISFGSTPAGKENTKRMNKLFLDLYLNGKADETPPIKAIALFEEFKELTPPDKRGNEMIRRLADRLVAVDLLEQAADILSRQLSGTNLNAEERSLTGTRLALVRLLNKEPLLALQALDTSENPNSSPSLQQHRKYIRAKALADTSKTKEALALLSGDTSSEANSLYTEILWTEKRWADVAEALRKTIKKPESRKGITTKEAQDILYWVTAMKLAGQERGVARARQNFIPYMKKSPYYDAFNLITSPIKSGVGDYRSLADDIKSIEGFKDFATSYSGRIKDSSLSGVIN
ncbi:MAG: hypothetical protein IKC13_02610 [Elusimicrobiaceae bacterium]|nr:hypothetical protein [Elusimicrobiaceae bacterium]